MSTLTLMMLQILQTRAAPWLFQRSKHYSGDQFCGRRVVVHVVSSATCAPANGSVPSSVPVVGLLVTKDGRT